MPRMVTDVSYHSGKYTGMGFDDHSILSGEWRNGRRNSNVCYRGILHVLCGLGQSLGEKKSRTCN
jgi:hypothetical protein